MVSLSEKKSGCESKWTLWKADRITHKQKPQADHDHFLIDFRKKSSASENCNPGCQHNKTDSLSPGRAALLQSHHCKKHQASPVTRWTCSCAWLLKCQSLCQNGGIEVHVFQLPEIACEVRATTLRYQAQDRGSFQIPFLCTDVEPLSSPQAWGSGPETEDYCWEKLLSWQIPLSIFEKLSTSHFWTVPQM